MPSYTAYENQTVANIALQECGTAEAEADIAYATGVQVDHVFTSGELVTIPDTAPRNEQMRSALEQKRKDLNQVPLPITTGIPNLPDGEEPTGLDYLPFPFELD